MQPPEPCQFCLETHTDEPCALCGHLHVHERCKEMEAGATSRDVRRCGCPAYMTRAELDWRCADCGGVRVLYIGPPLPQGRGTDTLCVACAPEKQP